MAECHLNIRSQRGSRSCSVRVPEYPQKCPELIPTNSDIKSPIIIPIPGTKKEKYLDENINSVHVKLSDADVDDDEMDAEHPVVGSRVREALSRFLDAGQVVMLQGFLPKIA